MTRHRILVTGASGFIGARLVRKLVEAGENVKAMVRASSSLKHLQGMPADQLEIVEGDVNVGHTVYRSLAGCDRMFHVAALTKFWDRNRGAVFQAAVTGTTETLEAARRRKIERVVITSSVGALGRTYDRVSMDESHEMNIPDADEYVRGKSEAEKIALAHAKDFEVVSVLPGAVYGPGDWKPTPGGASVLRFLGWSVPFVDFPAPLGGINVVDVDDVVDGHLLAMEKGKSGERYILGGENLTYEQIFTILAEITGLPGPGTPITSGLAEAAGRLMEFRAMLTGQEPEITFRMARDFVDKYSWVTSAKAETALGYQHRPARRALARSVAWYLENGYVDARVARRIRVDLRAPALPTRGKRCRKIKTDRVAGRLLSGHPGLKPGAAKSRRNNVAQSPPESGSLSGGLPCMHGASGAEARLSAARPSAPARQMKGGSTRDINDHRPLPHRLAWQDRHWAESLGPDDFAPLARYIRYQRERHDDSRPAERWQLADQEPAIGGL